jgi:glycosyltransferase involved in cell wall biosynthesis
VTDLEIGGTPSVVRELAVRLHDPPKVIVEVACLAKWGPTADQIEQGGVNVFALGAKGPTDIGAIWRLNSLIERNRYDTLFSFLIHANTATTAMKLLHSRLRVIQSIQTTQPEPRWHWMLQGWVQAAAERIVVPSESVKRAAIERSNIDATKIVVIPNAIEPREFVRSQTALDSSRPFPIGFIGRLDPIKQVLVLVREFAILARQRDVVLYIYGEGVERKIIEQEIQTWSLAPKVLLHGAIAKPQAALQQIGMLVLPSAAEGFGLVLIEAMAAGVPVIANRAPGMWDVVRDGENGLLVDVSVPGELAKAMRELIDDKEKRMDFIEEGLVAAQKQFSWQAVLPAYKELLGLCPFRQPQRGLGM